MEDVNESEARDLLKGVAATFDDNVPSLYRMLARSRVALAAFVHFEDILEQHGRLSRDEYAVVALEVAMSHKCNYCRGVMAGEARESGVSDDCIQAVLHGFEPAHQRYRLLVDATRRLMSESGGIGQAEVAVLKQRGVAFEELLEIIAIIAAFTLATYANNLARTRIDSESQ